MDDAVSSDQKIYSQSIPNDNSKMDLYILPDETYGPQANVSDLQSLTFLFSEIILFSVASPANQDLLEST